MLMIGKLWLCITQDNQQNKTAMFIVLETVLPVLAITL